MMPGQGITEHVLEGIPQDSLSAACNPSRPSDSLHRQTFPLPLQVQPLVADILNRFVRRFQRYATIAATNAATGVASNCIMDFFRHPGGTARCFKYMSECVETAVCAVQTQGFTPA